jgi:hypothetical protein
MDLSYNFGPDIGESDTDRWSFTIGTGFSFPRRTIPVISYRAEAP